MIANETNQAGINALKSIAQKKRDQAARSGNPFEKIELLSQAIKADEAARKLEVPMHDDNTYSTESLFNKAVESMKLIVSHTDGSVTEITGDPYSMEYGTELTRDDIDVVSLQGIDWDSDRVLPITEQYVEVTIKYRFDKVELSHKEKGE